MRIRKKKWALPELMDCGFYIPDPLVHKNNIKNCFTNPTLPLEMEFGCGRGRFIYKMAKLYPNRNFLAVDIKNDILGSAKREIEENYQKSPPNIRLMAYDLTRLPLLWSGEILTDRIYLNFSNPWPKQRHKKRALTHTRQLENYKQFLADGGEVIFKTDDDLFFEESLISFKEAGYEITFITYDLSNHPEIISPPTEHQEEFEERGIKTKYLIAKKI